MEKIVIFIIIMIVSSYFSKKKKEKANFTSTKKTDTTFFDDKGNKVSESRYKASSKPKVNSTEQPQSISDALSELKNIFSNTATPKPTPKPVPEPVPVYETNYGEVSTESNDSAYSEKDYKEVQSNYDSYLQKKQDNFDLDINKAHFKKTVNEVNNTDTYSSGKKKTPRKDILANLFNTKNQLKQAIIINEIFNKKY